MVSTLMPHFTEFLTEPRRLTSLYITPTHQTSLLLVHSQIVRSKFTLCSDIYTRVPGRKHLFVLAQTLPHNQTYLSTMSTVPSSISSTIAVTASPPTPLLALQLLLSTVSLPSPCLCTV